MRNKILSLLVLLLTAATGAWAYEPKVINSEIDYESLKVGDILVEGFSISGLYSTTFYFNAGRAKKGETLLNEDVSFFKGYISSVGTNTVITLSADAGDAAGIYTPIDENGQVANAWIVTSSNAQGNSDFHLSGYTYVDPNAEAPITVEWNASTKTGTFSMPGSDVVLTPIYSAATIYDANETEKAAYASLKEAFANVQDGDVIKLDWNVTLEEQLQTPITNDGVMFTLDFNGYILDGSALMGNAIRLNNSGDRMIFLDSTEGEMGGLKGTVVGLENALPIFVSGRYSMYLSAETLNKYCLNSDIYGMALADGKEFVDLEGGADANDGFTVRVAYKAIELTIGAGKFATFYAEQDFKVVEGTSIGLYTIMTDGIDLANNLITTSALNGSIIGGETPVLIYNGGSATQTVKLQATTETAASQMHASAFKGTDAGQTFEDTDMAAKDYYVLSGGSAFAPVKGKGTIAAHKCWLEFAKNNGNARSLTLVFENGETTGIDSMVNGQWSMDDYYDLNGRRIQRPTKKGVYVKDGNKVIIK